MRILRSVVIFALLASAAAFGQTTNNQCTKETDQQTTSGLTGTLTFLDSCGMRVNTWEMIVAGGPATNSVTIAGVMRGGTATPLATTTNTTNTNLSTQGGPYDKYTVTWTLTGGSTPTLTFNRTGSVTPVSSPAPFTGSAPASCSGNQQFMNTSTGALYTCAAGVPVLATGTTALAGITGGVQGQTVVGVSASGAAASPRDIDASQYCPSTSFSAGKCTSGDMCAAISAAATAAASLSGEVDARAFYGNNLCSAANITEMLNPLSHGGHVRLGNVHVYINGPCAATPCSTANTTNFSFADTSGGGTAPGTPALLIPPRVYLEGTIPRSDGAFGTVFEECQGVNLPAGVGCLEGVPQRSYPVSQIACPTTGTLAQKHACVVTVTVASGTSCGSAANCAPNSGVAISTRDCGAANPTWAWIAGATTHTQNFAGTVSLCTATGFTMQAAVDDTVTAASMNCTPCTGAVVYLPTPIVGFMNGDASTVAYVTSNSGNSVCYGCYIGKISLTASNYEGSVGFEDLFGQERSGADHLSATQDAWCLAIRGPQSQNGGAFDINECNAGSFTSCEGHGYFWLQNAGAVRGLRGATFNAGTSAACNSQAEQSNAMIVTDGQGIVIDTNYLSGGYDGILMGSQQNTHGITVINGFCGAGGTALSCQGNGIAISAAFSATDVSVTGFSIQNATFLNVLKNFTTGCGTGASDQQIGAYFYDNNGVGKIQEFSTSELCPPTWGNYIKVNGVIATGTTAPLSGCAESGGAGGPTAGKFASGTTGVCAVTITLPTATNGWACSAQDITHPATFTQTAFGAATATISATTTSADVVAWQCIGS